MKKADIGLTPAQTGIIAKILEPLLADEFLLYLKTRNAHWNIEGQTFTPSMFILNNSTTSLKG